MLRVAPVISSARSSARSVVCAGLGAVSGAGTCPAMPGGGAARCSTLGLRRRHAHAPSIRATNPPNPPAAHGHHDGRLDMSEFASAASDCADGAASGAGRGSAGGSDEGCDEDGGSSGSSGTDVGSGCGFAGVDAVAVGLVAGAGAGGRRSAPEPAAGRCTGGKGAAGCVRRGSVGCGSGVRTGTGVICGAGAARGGMTTPARSSAGPSGAGLGVGEGGGS